MEWQINRTLARSMLLDAKLSQKFWAEAVSTAAYFKNKSPTSSLKVTPQGMGTSQELII